jgi:hypothetical protein
MSRSYKKNLIQKCGYGSKGKVFMKNYANRKIRRSTDEVPNGNKYRRYTDPWDLCDFVHHYDPNRHIYSWGGEMRVIEPDPLWKWRRK